MPGGHPIDVGHPAPGAGPHGPLGEGRPRLDLQRHRLEREAEIRRLGGDHVDLLADLPQAVVEADDLQAALMGTRGRHQDIEQHRAVAPPDTATATRRSDGLLRADLVGHTKGQGAGRGGPRLR